MIFDFRVLSIPKLFGLQPTPEQPEHSDKWKKYYPHPETIGRVDISEFPEKPQVNTHPMFPNIKFRYGFGGYPVINSDPTIRDCIQNATNSDWIVHIVVAAVFPMHALHHPMTRNQVIGWTILGMAVGWTGLIVSSGCTFCLLIIYVL